MKQWKCYTDSAGVHYDTYRMEKSKSMCAPACRMVVVNAYVEKGKGGVVTRIIVKIHPVLALIERTVAEYTRTSAGEGKRTMIAPANHRCAIDNGFYFDGIQHEVDALFWMDDDCGVCDMTDVFCENEKSILVSCPWPEEEDGWRLQSFAKFAALKAGCEYEQLPDAIPLTVVTPGGSG